MAAALAVTPLGKLLGEPDGGRAAAWRLELRDLSRALAGALFISLPLLFTMEMWDIARAMPAGVLLGFLAASLVINRLFLLFAGFRHRNWVAGSDWWDVLVAAGVGALASAMTLAVFGVIGPGTDPVLALRVVALETVPTSMGAVVAINQLGPGDSGKRSHTLRRSTDLRVVIGALLGGFLFAFNVAPTVEPKLVAVQQGWPLAAATLLLSLAVTHVTVHLTEFEERDLSGRQVITTPWLETAVAYAIAFAVSAALLFVFGYASPLDPPGVWLGQAIALAYATALGGAVGRLVL
jgi:putative integral membrane protein (TIGR02587 family)